MAVFFGLPFKDASLHGLGGWFSCIFIQGSPKEWPPGAQVWRILFLLLVTTYAWPSSRSSLNLGSKAIFASEEMLGLLASPAGCGTKSGGSIDVGLGAVPSSTYLHPHPASKQNHEQDEDSSGRRIISRCSCCRCGRPYFNPQVLERRRQERPYLTSTYL